MAIMASPKGKKQDSRAQAFGTRVRELRRGRKETLAELAERIPMSASNLSRLELGSQAPPADEDIERLAAALETDAGELLRAAGRSAGGKSFEERVLDRLDALSEDVQRVKDAVEGKRPKS
jgi:transcriptional regulator with XRE-family HTH domain